VAGRYEILDILAQDKSGIVFHAEERESGRSVVLRRFFPYGPEGGGLQEAERAAYMAAGENSLLLSAGDQSAMASTYAPRLATPRLVTDAAPPVETTPAILPNSGRIRPEYRNSGRWIASPAG